MTIYHWLIIACWMVFIVFWLISSLNIKRSRSYSFGAFGFLMRLLALFILIGLARLGYLQQSIHRYVEVPASVGIAGVALAVIGIGFALWARVYLGRNWGMPMSMRVDPELVTSGPYRYVRHPIYTGVLLAMLGTALVIGSWWFVFFLFGFAYFVYSAITEERLLEKEFPGSYSEYKKRTKMLIPYVL